MDTLATRLLVALALLGSCGTSPPAESPEPKTTTPEPAPTAVADARVSLADADTVRAAIEDASGHVRVFNFWATWCQPCIAELPHLAKLQAEDPELEVLLISLDHKSIGTAPVQGFLRKQGLPLQSLMLDAEDPAIAVTEVYPDFPGAIPITLVVNAEGEVDKAFHQAVTLGDLQRAVDEAR